MYFWLSPIFLVRFFHSVLFVEGQKSLLFFTFASEETNFSKSDKAAIRRNLAAKTTDNQRQSKEIEGAKKEHRKQQKTQTRKEKKILRLELLMSLAQPFAYDLLSC